MRNNSVYKIIGQAEKIITDIFENGTHDKDSGEGLYRAMTLLADVISTISDIDDLLFDAVITAKKLEALANVYCEQYFTDEDNERQETYLAATIHDYAAKSCDVLKNISVKLS
ncbi:hypothetical protein [Citrobacter portucalensis]|uniref:hypothetical protein n=1 Tax=Citrobacter portucalensis TaxID=1639133 RepID=UPI0023AF9B0D|nr:hypothetical protein [Citrobacter portucalensis]